MVRIDAKHRMDRWIGSFLGLRGPKQTLRKEQTEEGHLDFWQESLPESRTWPGLILSLAASLFRDGRAQRCTMLL